LTAAGPGPPAAARAERDCWPGMLAWATMILILL
jgi:hypothetical protein